MDPSAETVDSLREYCRREVGDSLRVISYFSRGDHVPVYTRGDIPPTLGQDEDVRAMYRFPYSQAQRAAYQLGRLNPLFGDPQALSLTYENVDVVQIPITESEGITITVDAGARVPDRFVDGCRDIVRNTPNAVG